MYQLEMFRSQEEILVSEIEKIKESTSKVRRSMYARHAELAKMYHELHIEFQQLKESICKNNT